MPRGIALGLVLLLGLIFVPAQLSRGPWGPDEPRYVEVAREMGARGDYLLPRLNGEVYAEKPPFYFWLVVAAERVTGSWLVAARLVSALGIVVAAGATFLLGAHLRDRTVGALGALVFLTSASVTDHGTRAAFDPLLTGLVTLATYALLRGLVPVAALAMAAGVLTKGPVAVFLPALAALSIGVARGSVPRLGLAASIAVAALAGLGWLWLASHAAGGDYLRRMGLEQTVHRVAGSELTPHAHKPHYHLTQLLWGFLPWIPLLPGAVRAASKERGARLGVLAWVGLGFAFFSAITGKRTGYVLPLYPGLALLVAWRLAETDETALDRAGRFAAAGFVAVSGVVLAVFPWVAGLLPHVLKTRRFVVERIAGDVPGHAVPLALVLGAAAAALGVVALRRPRVFVPGVAGAFAVLVAGLNAVFFAALDPQMSCRGIGEAVVRLVPPGERLALYPEHYDGAIHLATRRLEHEVLATVAALESARSDRGVLWVVANHWSWTTLDPEVAARFERLETHRFGRDDMFVLRERREP